MSKKIDPKTITIEDAFPASSCMIKDCQRPELIRTNFHSYWLLLCRDHMNRLRKYLGYTKEHEDMLVATAQYRRMMSGHPLSSGLSSDQDVASEFVSLETKIFGIIEGWLRDPEEAERIMYD